MGPLLIVVRSECCAGSGVDVLTVFMLFEHSHFPGGSQLLFRIGVWMYR